MKTLILIILYFLIPFNIKANDMIDSLKMQISKKDINAIENLISENPQVLDLQDENGSSGFMLIAYSGLEKVLLKAIEHKKYFTFHEAIVCGNLSIVEEHIKTDKTLANTLSNDGFTPLSLSAFFNQMLIAKLLLDYGADPNVQAQNPSKVNALHSAVAKENLELCKLLIDKGVNVNAVQMQNVTALHSATHRGNLKIVMLLIENGATIEMKMDNGDTPISIAEREGHSKIKVFLESKLKD